MKQVVALCVMVVLAVGCFAAEEEGFVSLFDGKSLDGWKASENKDSFKVEDGKIVVFGPRSHLFYEGPVGNHDFKNFELKLEAMTTPGSNSGVYFHTQYQDKGWPGKGMECQVNATHSDPKKTGSLYNIKNVMNKAPHKDDEWWTYGITVNGKTVTLKVNGETVNEWTEEPGSQRKLSHGTVCLQGHDPKSKVFYRNIRIKLLPD